MQKTLEPPLKIMTLNFNPYKKFTPIIKCFGGSFENNAINWYLLHHAFLSC